MELINFAYLNIALFLFILYFNFKMSNLKKETFKDLQMHEQLMLKIPLLYMKVVASKAVNKEISSKYSKILLLTWLLLILFMISNFIVYFCSSEKCIFIKYS